GGVDRNPVAHLPGRVVQRLLNGDVSKFRLGSVKERAARGRKPYAADFVHLASPQALVHGVVLAINGEKRLALAAGLRGDEFTSRNQALFVGEANGLTGFNRLVGSFEPGDTHNRANDEIGFRMCGYADRAGRSVGDFDVADSVFVEPRAKVVGVRLGGNGDHARTPALCLLKGQIEVAASGQSGDLKTVGKRLNHTEGAAADGAGRSQNRNALHG